MILRPTVHTHPIPFAAPAQHTTSQVKSQPIVRRSPVIVRNGADAPTSTAKFLGQGALSVQSTVSGKHYRFQGQGHCLIVDQRDVLMLGRIPDLLVS
jgi:hypothetical protein